MLLWTPGLGPALPPQERKRLRAGFTEPREMQSVCSLARDEEKETVKLTLVSRCYLCSSLGLSGSLSTLHRFIPASAECVSLSQISLQNRRLLAAPWWTLVT